MKIAMNRCRSRVFFSPVIPESFLIEQDRFEARRCGNAASKFEHPFQLQVTLEKTRRKF